MLGFVLIYGLFVIIGVGSYFSGMGIAQSAPQACQVAASAMFTVMVPYTLVKVALGWKSLENQKELLKLLSERQQS